MTDAHLHRVAVATLASAALLTGVAVITGQAGSVPQPPPPLPTSHGVAPAAHATGAQHDAATRVVRVVSQVRMLFMTVAEERGSGWTYAPDYIVTDAHVVANGGTVTVDRPHARALPATVVLFDPAADIAVLHVPGLAMTPLRWATTSPRSGTSAVSIGFPWGHPVEVLEGATVQQSMTARVSNIVDVTQPATMRALELVSARVVPGDSGGPLVRDDGTVIGTLCMQYRGTDSSYYNAPAQYAPDLHAALGRTREVAR